MSLTLNKGSKFTLNKNDGSELEVLRVELSWDAPEQTKGMFSKKVDYDLDACAFILDENGQAVDNHKHFCFFQQQQTPAIQSSGDDLNGDEGEALLITLENVPDNGKSIPIIVDLHKAKKKKQNLSQMKAGFVKIVNDATDEVLAEISMNNFKSNETSILFVMIHRTEDGWDVENVSTGYDKGLEDWVELYGIDLEK